MLIRLFVISLGAWILLVGQTLHAEDDIDTLIAEMSLEHKVGQMFMVNLYGPVLTDIGREVLETWQPGGIVLLVSNIQTPAQITQLTNSFQSTIIDAGGVPLFLATDQEGGLIARLQDGFTTWPVPMLLTASDDPQLAFRVGEAMARELRAVGFNMNFAPVLDLLTNRQNPIIGRRSPGDDPEVVGRVSAGFIQGMQSTGVLATAKHFPGHGDTSDDSHATLPMISHSHNRLSALELVPFLHAIDAEVSAIMVGHIWMRAFDPEEAVPASLSHNVVSGLLRNELGFEGIILTDALEMAAIELNYSPQQAAVMAVAAGADMLVYGPGRGEQTQMQAMHALVDAVRTGLIDEARIDDSARRILRIKRHMGILDWSPLDPITISDRLNPDLNAPLVQEVFESGVTVTRDYRQLLPVSEYLRVGMIYSGNRSDTWQACSQYRDDVHWLAVSESPTIHEVESARYLASLVDVVVVFTHNAYVNPSVQSLVRALPSEQVVLVALAAPYDDSWIQEIGAYVMSYSPLPPAADAVCEVILGVRPARGRPAVMISP